jgi:hypothetical protein
MIGIMINSNSTHIITATKNIIDFFFTKPDLCQFTITMAAQHGGVKLLYIHHLTPLLQLVFNLWDWSSSMYKYNASARIAPVPKF